MNPDPDLDVNAFGSTTLFKSIETHLRNDTNLGLIAKVEIVFELALVQLDGEVVRHILHHRVRRGTLQYTQTAISLPPYN